MRTIIINDNNLKDKDINYQVIRTKAFIINDKNEIILVHNNNTYQFPGGHLELGESLIDSIRRELKEELGINNVVIRNPFLEIDTYDNNYFNSSDKVLNKIIYFKVETNDKPNLENLELDLIEKNTPFNIVYVRVEELTKFILEEKNKGNMDPNIAREMLLADKFYQYLYEKIDII